MNSRARLKRGRLENTDLEIEGEDDAPQDSEATAAHFVGTSAQPTQTMTFDRGKRRKK